MVPDQGATILIIEDDAGVARLQQRRLDRAGYRVIAVGTPDEGMRKLEQGGVDLLLLDYRLTDNRNGLEVYAHLKEQGHDVPVILVTGFCDEVTVIQALRVGVRDFVTKSVEYLDYLPEAVGRVLKQVRAEERLRDQAAMLDQATDAIVVHDLGDQIRFWNRGAERLYGWTAAEAQGQNAGQLLHKAAASDLEEVRRVVVEKGEWAGELRQVTKAGEEVIVASRWTLMCGADGRPKSKLVINTDLTEKKKLEAQFLRTQRIESLGTLAGGIAHDLNNVLTPIVMAVELLRGVVPPEAQETLLAPLQASAEHGTEMVKQILSFTRGSEGARKQLLQVRYVLRDIEKMLRHTLPKEIELHTAVPRELWTISADATQVHQILMNLCLNARDAMPGRGRLAVEAENVSLDESYVQKHPGAAPGAYVRLKVRDTGSGIPGDILDKVFDPFFTTKEIGKGTGLGLFTVLGLVKAHGGFLEVDTKVGQGTQFSVYLPAAADGECSVAPSSEVQVPEGHGELILIVDDEASIRAITRGTLEAHGYRVLTAGEGTEALALYAQHQGEIKAVLTDLMMPIMGGPLTIRALHNMDPKLPIIAVSGLMPQGQEIDVAGLGVRLFLQKPYTAPQLLKALAKVLGRPDEAEGGSTSAADRATSDLRVEASLSYSAI